MKRGLILGLALLFCMPMAKGQVNVFTLAGANAGEKITSCISSLSSAGGACSMAGFDGQGGQTISTDIFTGTTKKVTILWGSGTYNFTSSNAVPSNVSFVARHGTILAPAAGTTLTINGPFSGTEAANLGGSGTILFGAGSLLFSSGTFLPTTNQLILGTSPNQTTLSGPPPSGNVTLTFPSTTDTIVGRATTDTLTNKTLTSPTLTTPVIGAATGTSLSVTGNLTSTTGTIIGGTVGTNVGAVQLFNATSGSVTLSPVTGALGTVTLSLPAATDTLVGKATTDTLTNKTLTSPTMTSPTVNTSFLQGSAFKHQRFGATTATAAAVGATANTTFTWTSAFADANYTVACMGVTPTGVPAIVGLSATQLAATISIQVVAITAAAASYANIDCIAAHD